ncbi:MAG: hypothetical protein GXO92_02840 [FCB group bacterium]|nr:hypothetical protein [FCB group bacterium]
MAVIGNQLPVKWGGGPPTLCKPIKASRVEKISSSFSSSDTGPACRLISSSAVFKARGAFLRILSISFDIRSVLK